jgi:UDP-N-acetylmuramate dehydrogenase
MRVAENASLRALNTFGVDARARRLVALNTLEDVGECLARGLLGDTPRLILGGGSNLLLTRDFPGVVLKVGFRGLETVREDGERVWVRVGAGEPWDGFVRQCMARGWYGLENLVRIPGLVGAGPVQNIGAYGVELESAFDALDAVDLETGEARRFRRADCGFAYRASRFKKEPRDRFLITSVTFALWTSPRPVARYAALRRELEKAGEAVTPEAVAAAVDRLRRRRLPDPETLGNAGSFFQNPVLEPGAAAVLCEAHPDLPRYPEADGRVKVAAGWLIEQCGWKGRRVGRCGVYAHQALVLVNHGGATGGEILDLARRIQESVAERFGVVLEPEPRIL